MTTASQERPVQVIAKLMPNVNASSDCIHGSEAASTRHINAAWNGTVATMQPLPRLQLFVNYVRMIVVAESHNTNKWSGRSARSNRTPRWRAHSDTNSR